ncbi:hypothetical protein GCM10010145_61300 [Streptomyces ruber]|uniref:Uncharacterized protein n=2 Tax=Streptomyces TaxID=1883 RepID=A0A918BPS4_9ACTN|nr:hypothetical protein [Streptomyces ruber]GGQ83501.1 hypothetical protein GCM10010145_61300 [Streptomyces ruber]
MLAAADREADGAHPLEHRADEHPGRHINTDPTKGTLTIGGPIVDGPLTGDTFTVVPVVVHPNPDCATKGLTDLTFTAAQVAFN